jgi:hypothetical protein
VLDCWIVGSGFEGWANAFCFFSSMNSPEIKIDKYGWSYFDSLPEGYRLATLDDFHVKGKRKVGMEYLNRWIDDPNYYEIRSVKNDENAARLRDAIQLNLIFIKI